MPSTKLLLTAAAACFLFALAVPTVAITVGEDTAADNVVLEPTSRYASVDANGDIRLDLEALNKRAITTADDVFAITVNDDAVERVWISNEGGLEFYEGTDRTATITERTPLEPSAGETTSVGVAVDTHGDYDSTETFTVHVAYADEADDDDENDTDAVPKGINLESLEVHPTTLETGDTVTANATYRNNGRTTEQVTSALTVDGTVVDTETLEVEPNETASVVFERRMQWPGTYEVGVDGIASESVTVEGPPIDVLSATVSPVELTVGDTATTEATVSNPTETRVDRTLELAVDGIVVDAKTVSIAPESERTVTFERQFDDAGTHDIAVSGVKAGSVTVTEREPFPIRNRELSAATTAALAPPMATGFLFVAVAANRRWAFVSRR
ncbi:CARDB domain-containing protein [Natronorubrum halophilum]|uniref:CARDB domain-containing protein n=1 Tax=Natronorubrum halophilum TaxID=1702106 RepID=UPI000EF7262D|nr:CARDB domain-containing protein [Natronorubrum halophilum]